jgi:hypothetical protein
MPSETFVTPSQAWLAVEAMLRDGSKTEALTWVRASDIEWPDDSHL